MRATGRWIWALVLLAIRPLLRWLRRERGGAGRTLPPPRDEDAASIAVLALLVTAGACGAGFATFYVLGLSTQLLGLALGSALACFSAASLLAGKRLVPQEERAEEIEERDHPEEREVVDSIAVEAGEGISRRRLMIGAAGASVAVTGAAVLLPAASLGPVLDTARLKSSPWRAGRRLVDEKRAPIIADDLEIGAFVTAFPEGADFKPLDSSLIVVRVRPQDLALPPERSGWAPDGLIAFSKICTHAACAVSEFNYPTYPPTSPAPRLVCPCHYSAFSVGEGGTVVSGPAGRPLPQLPLSINDAGELQAAGELSGPPGPAWSGVRT